MVQLVGSDQFCALSFWLILFQMRVENVAAKGTKISLGLNFARNLDSVGWVLISSPLWLITSQRREMLLQFLLPIKTTDRNLRARELVFLHQGKERGRYKRNRKCLYIPQNINCAAPTSNQDHWPESLGTFPLADAFLLLTSSHPKTEEKTFTKGTKKSLNSIKFRRYYFFSQSAIP